MARNVVLAAAVAVLVIAVPLPSVGEGRVQMEADMESSLLHDFVRGERVHDATPLKFVFMLRHDRDVIEKMDRLFWDVSNPKHESYGQFLSLSQLARLTAVNPSNVAAVTSWIQSHMPSSASSKLVSVSRTGDSITATVPAIAAQRMFQTNFHVFAHRQNDKITVVRAGDGKYTLPESIAELLYLVEGVSSMPRLDGPIVMLDRYSANTAESWPQDCGSECGAFTTPQVLATRYNIVDKISQPTKGNMSVAEFQGQYWDQDDLSQFADQCGISNFTVDHTIGGNMPAECKVGGCVEALLDLQYIVAVAGGIPLTDVYTNSYNLLDWATALDNEEDVPLVMSVSYGNDEVQQTSDAFMESANAQFMKLGLRGVSVLFASGDQGVWGRTGPGVFKHRYHPDFPASSPYITAVGGTDFVEQGVIGDEKSWSASGGGFSDTFGIPDWQADAVAAYKTEATNAGKLPEAKLFNDTGRGYPDVAALGGEVNPYCIVSGGRVGGVAGTSASCPVVAGIFARLNEVRLHAGKAPLGPLNQWIYGLKGQGFQDVTQGENKGAGASGFYALKGWDPATGWGTPNYQELVKLV